jgi:hypothetical protein
MTSRLYLYGIFPAPGPQDLQLEGLDKQPVHTEIVDNFTFLYSEARQERYLASRRNLLGHEKVLEQAMEVGYRTLLPLQFGLVIEDWETVTSQLTAPYGQGLEKLFTKLDGQREVGVKVFWEADRELQLLLAENQSLKEKRDSLEGRTLSMDEVVSIGQTIERAMEARKQTIIQTFRDTLNPFAGERVENDTLMESMIYNAAYLIPWETEPDFSAQVEVLDSQFDGRLKIRYNNFTAPFNFAHLDRLE